MNFANTQSAQCSGKLIYREITKIVGEQFFEGGLRAAASISAPPQLYNILLLTYRTVIVQSVHLMDNCSFSEIGAGRTGEKLR